MDKQGFRLLSQLEEYNWYEITRKRILGDIINKIIKSQDVGKLNILDVGCGTGGTTEFLRTFGNLTAIEPAQDAVEILRSRYPGINLIKASLCSGEDIFAGENFNLVTLLGVLYHRAIKDPELALRELFSYLAPGGWIIWHEPVFPILRRDMDEISHGARRFGTREMVSLIENSGFEVKFRTCLSSYAFLPALLFSLRSRIFGYSSVSHSLEFKPLPRLLNESMKSISTIEWWIARNLIRLPVGVSQILVAKRP